jgi:N-acetylmuramoyl-L-alanine amidase
MTQFRFYFGFLFFVLCVPVFTAKSDPLCGATQWRTLSNVQTALGATNYVWDGDSLCFSNDQTFVRFYQGRRKTDVNGTTVWLNAPPDGSVTGGSWRLAAADLDLLLISMLPQTEGPVKPVCVMIDAGHGGDDDGANSKKPPVKEKDLTLALALQLGACLTNSGLSVVYTRTNDVTLALDERSALAHRSKADLFVSLHANFARSSDVTGTETYVLTPCGFTGTAQGSSRPKGWQPGNRFDYHSTLLGFSVQRHLAVLGQSPDRGLKRQAFSVLRETSCPSVLIEVGFLSNHAEAKKMLDGTWQQQCVHAIADGILGYAKKVDGLDRAIAEKRARDSEANERWRLRLAAKAAASAADATNALASAQSSLNAVSTTAGSSVSNATLLAHADHAELLRASVQASRLASAGPAAPSDAQSPRATFPTNTPPLQLSTLFDFYVTDPAE